MARKQEATYGIQALYRFPTYMTRGAYKEATGREAPPYNPTMRPKYWEHPDPEAGKFGFVWYDLVVYGVEDGKPLSGTLPLPVEIASTVNIPYDGNQTTDPVRNSDPIPVPLHPLEPDEEFYIHPFAPDLVVVKNIPAFNALAKAEAEKGGNFTTEDREMLREIRADVKALLAKR